VELGNQRTPLWKEDFTARVLQRIRKGEPVWISKRLLREIPLPEWEWTEGDDPNVRWREFPMFFRALDYTHDVGGEDGFQLLSSTARNSARLLGVLQTRTGN
jgi:hypothetical protein